jgi:RHS repeat-associated protein
MHYNPLGQEIERLVTGGITSKRSYDEAGRQCKHQVHNKTRSHRNTKYLWNPNNQLQQILDINANTNTQFTYNAVGSLASAQYADASFDFKLPDAVGNLYKTKEKNQCQYGKGGKLLQDKHWHYFYNAEGNLIKKSKNNTVQLQQAYEQQQKDNPPSKLTWFDKLIGYKETPEPDFMPQTNAHQWQYGEWQYTWQANGMLASAKDPKGKITTFAYDALGRRTTKINVATKEINRYIYDGNVLLHEFRYEVKNRPKTIADDLGRLSLDREEDTSNIITWVFDEGTFVPQAKITNKGTFSIISDYLGTPILSFDEQGNKVWERELDIYGKVRKGDNTFCPFTYQGQYYDPETELCYNRFRYYSPDTGTYISQDPIGLAGGTTNLYQYVWDTNSVVDRLGLSGSPIVVIGEGQKGVDAATKALREAGYNAESMMTPKNQWKGGILKKGMSESKFQKAVDWNKQWLKDKIADGYKVVDIGTDGRAVRSRFYQAELDALKETNTSKIKLKKLPDGESIGDMRKRISCG